jgi:hypothetical protein
MLSILMLLADVVVDFTNDGKGGWDEGKAGWDSAKDDGKAGW